MPQPFIDQRHLLQPSSYHLPLWRKMPTFALALAFGFGDGCEEGTAAWAAALALGFPLGMALPLALPLAMPLAMPFGTDAAAVSLSTNHQLPMQSQLLSMRPQALEQVHRRRRL